MKILRFSAWFIPLGLLLVSSLAGPWMWPELLPREWTIRAYQAFDRQMPRISTYLGTSLLVSLAAVALSLMVSLPAARELARRPRPFLEALLVLPALLPPLACLWGMQGTMAKLGLGDTAAGLVLALTSLAYPYTLRSLLESYRLIPTDMLACARNLGASPARAFLEVELPLLLPGLVSGASITFLAAWSDYLAFFLVGGASVPGYTLFLYPFLMSSDRAMASVGVLVFVSFPLFLFALSQYLVRGVFSRVATAKGRGGFHV